MTVTKDCVVIDCFPVVGIDMPQFTAESLVDFLDDLIHSGKQALEEVLRPLFKCFCHDGVVGVADGVGDDVPCLVPTITIVVKKDAHKFGYAKSGVCVVDVDCHTICKVVKRRIRLEMTLDDALD